MPAWGSFVRVEFMACHSERVVPKAPTPKSIGFTTLFFCELCVLRGGENTIFSSRSPTSPKVDEHPNDADKLLSSYIFLSVEGALPWHRLAVPGQLLRRWKRSRSHSKPQRPIQLATSIHDCGDGRPYPGPQSQRTKDHRTSESVTPTSQHPKPYKEVAFKAMQDG